MRALDILFRILNNGENESANPGPWWSRMRLRRRIRSRMPEDLEAVQRAAAAKDQALAAFHETIWRAYDAGWGVREIAPYAGLSPTRVYQIVREVADKRSG